MKIKNISCRQFAGVRDENVSFTDGINVIYGKNETGKSTLVNLISRTLFQSAHVDGRSDKTFRDLYFPGARKGNSVKGDFADGRITFETSEGTYTLEKEWCDDARCILSTPNGVVRDSKTISEILRDVLLYGEGVYADMLFSSQRNTDMSLQTILDASKKTESKQELTDALSQAFAESDGVSVDAIEQALNAKIDEIAGKHWDFDRDMPDRKNGRWSNGIGQVLKTYYAWEDAKNVLDQIGEKEEDVDNQAQCYEKTNADYIEAKEKYEAFEKTASSLLLQNANRKHIKDLTENLQKEQKILDAWPGLAESLKKAKALKAEKANREVLDQYDSVKAIAEQIGQQTAKSPNALCPNEEEINNAKIAQKSILKLENKLCGMNLNAAVQMLDGHSIEVKSLRTGKTLNLSDGRININEAVAVVIPGVMEMQLTPADVDAETIEKQLAEKKAVLTEIFTKYNVQDTDELEQLQKSNSDAERNVKLLQAQMNMQLGQTTFEELEAKANAITTDVRSKFEILQDIMNCCQGLSEDTFIGQKDGLLREYTAAYGSIELLKEKVEVHLTELQKENETVVFAENIPEEFRKIDDPEAYLKRLKEDVEYTQRQRETAKELKVRAETALNEYQAGLEDDPKETFAETKAAFEEQKALLKHWMHIKAVFDEQKENLHNNPMQDIAERFTHYLSIISGGKVSSEFPEADKLKMNIYSSDHLLDYGKLSEGTKETVSLAFRLAVLDHLFPDGGGVIVFDDPFTDMDAERTEESCKLIKECAKRHQVIFLTCREEYLPMLEGNRVLL